MTRRRTPLARPARILTLAIVPGSFCLAGPAAAETRAGVDVSVSGKVASNPFLQPGASSGVAAEGAIYPWLTIVDERSSVDLRGSFSGSTYTGGNGTDRSIQVQLDARREMSPYFSIRGGASYLNSNAGIHDDLLSRTGAADDVPPPPVNPTPDTTFVGFRSRTESFNARLGFTVRPGPRDSLGVDLGASRSLYGPIAGADYDYYSASLSYSRQLSPHTSVVADVLVAKSDYADTRTGDGTIVTPQIGLQRQFSRTLTASASLGASFSRTRRADGSTAKFTTFSGTLRLCNQGDRSVLCFNANRSAQPRAVGGITAVTSVDFTFDRQLSLRNSLTLTARYSKNDNSTLLGGGSQFYGVSGTFTRGFNRRLVAFVTPGYSRIDEHFRPSADNFQLAIGLRYRFGALS